MKQRSFSTNFCIAEPFKWTSQMDDPYQDFSGKNIYLVAIRQIIKVLPDNLSRVNECATMPSVNNMTKSTWQINKTQDFPNFSTILSLGLYFPIFLLVPDFSSKRT